MLKKLKSSRSLLLKMPSANFNFKSNIYNKSSSINPKSKISSNKQSCDNNNNLSQNLDSGSIHGS